MALEEPGLPEEVYVFPASYAQQRLWFLDQFEPGSPYYNIPAAVRLSGRLDVAALERTFQEIVRRHETLRTTFETIDGQPVQVIALEASFALPLTDLTHLPEQEREAEALRLAAEEARRPFDLSRGPLLRAQLLRLGKLGSFDFNSRFYADDDLIVGAADPFQLFRILYEVIRGGGYGVDSEVAFMLDQCHNVDDKIPGQIRSVLTVQEMTARALLVDRAALTVAQDSGDVHTANGLFMDAFYTDVRPALADWREQRGLPRDPLAAYAASGYADAIIAERVGGTQASWGA